MNTSDLAALSFDELIALAARLAHDCSRAQRNGDGTIEWSRLEPALLELCSRAQRNRDGTIEWWSRLEPALLKLCSR